MQLASGSSTLPPTLFLLKGTRRAGMLVPAGFFSITVTRFAQMARYLVLNDLPVKTTLDDIGLGLAFYKCLAELNPKDLRVYGAIKQDPQLIQQLIELYHEMTKSQMSFGLGEFNR